jgi:lipoyl(octanoyl) transferase
VTDSHTQRDVELPGRALSAYLLGTLDYDGFLALQRRLVYDVSGDRTSAAVILCDHPPGVTIGREGSRAHIRPSLDELGANLRNGDRTDSTSGLPVVRWVGRGGGVMLHLPGQVACYPIIPLDLVGLSPARYVEELLQVGLEVVRSYNLTGTIDADRPGIRANGRRLIHLGVAVRTDITCFGLVLNVDPDLDLFRDVYCDGDRTPMTSLQRESVGGVRPSGVRQRLLDLLAARFGFDRVSIFHNHPSALPRSTRHAFAPRS